jgi:hypothetical protein
MGMGQSVLLTAWPRLAPGQTFRLVPIGKFKYWPYGSGLVCTQKDLVSIIKVWKCHFPIGTNRQVQRLASWQWGDEYSKKGHCSGGLYVLKSTSWMVDHWAGLNFPIGVNRKV